MLRFCSGGRYNVTVLHWEWGVGCGDGGVGCWVDVAGELRNMEHVTRHTSHVTRHTSHVTRHTSLASRCSADSAASLAATEIVILLQEV